MNKKKYMNAMRRARAAVALALILASMLLFLLPVFGASGQKTPENAPSAQETRQVTKDTPEEAEAMVLVLGDDAPELTAESMKFEIPDAGTSFKTLMDYRCIRDRTSRQWLLQQGAWTDEQGFRRYEDYYMVALGTYYASECGRLFRIAFEGGGVIDVVVGDIKADADTDSRHQHRDGNVVEFIVDMSAISRDCLVMGDMSWAGDMFRGRVASIEYLGEI